MKLAAPLGDTFLEPLDLLAGKFWLLQVASWVELIHGFQSLFDIVIVLLQLFHGFCEEIYRRVK